jgi:hypothetical protein
MMAGFTLTPVEKGILRCKHSAPFSAEDVRALAKFFEDYHGKLLVDLTETTGEDCARNIREFRPMMPTAAIFGVRLDPAILQIPESYYARPVRYFESEAEALAWLRDQ